MSEKRNVRANETRTSVREEQSRPDTAWKPPSLLDAPEPRPGYTQRWIATSIQGKETPDNVYKRMREKLDNRFIKLVSPLRDVAEISLLWMIKTLC